MTCALCDREEVYLAEYTAPDGKVFNIWLCKPHKGPYIGAVRHGHKTTLLDRRYREGKIKPAQLSDFDRYTMTVMILAQQARTQHYNDLASQLKVIHELDDAEVATFIGGLMAKGLLFSPRLSYMKATDKGMKYPTGIKKEWRWDYV
jgi:hypothetical protein